MNARRAYTWLAVANLICGALLFLIVLGTLLTVPRASDVKVMVFGYSILAVLAFAGVMLVRYAYSHLRRPARSSALTLATNSAVLLWVFLGGVLQALGLREIIGPLYTAAAAALAYLCYRWLLKPAALRAFPAEADAD